MKHGRPPIPQPRRRATPLRKQPGAAMQDPAAQLARALALHQQGHLDQAGVLYKEILQAQPQHFDALQLLATISAQRSEAADAVALFEQALKINPNHPGVLNNYGNALRGLQRLDEALKSFSHALQIDPGYAEAHANEGLCRLLMGDFAGGWPKREWRWKTEQGLRLSRNFPQALWLGKEELKNKTILLYGEQGFGDTIQFCRYVRQVAARGARVVLEVQPQLKTLLQNLEGVSQLVGRGERLPAFDFHCPLMSLPLAFQTEMGSITGEPYLKSDPEKLRKWRTRLGETKKKRIGLVWSGNAVHANDKNRSLALEDVATLLDDDAHYYCLQKELRPADRDALTRLPGIEFLGDSLEDFSDTAAVVDLMDVVITVDTSVAHLAGALGKEVWVLLSFSPDWRWLLERSDSPWYASARLFRQQSIGDWASVLMRVKAELKARLQAPEGKAPATPVQSIAASLATALALHQQGRLDQAGALYREILQAQPNHFDALQLLATVAAQQNKAADAVVLFERALKINPADTSVLNNYGAALEDLKRPEEALASYDRALQIEPGYAEAWFNRGNALQSLGRLEEALDSFERAVQIRPDHADALVSRGGALRGLKRYEEALTAYERVLAISPDRVGVLISRGNTLRALKRPEEALASYERALQIRPDAVEAISNKGNALRDLKRFTEALASYERAVQLHPDSMEAHNNLGNALWDMKRSEEALASYDRALKIFPNYPQALSSRGNALQDLRRLEEALASYDRALQIDPHHLEALSNRGNVLRELKRFEEALDSYERALQIDPDYPEALSNRGNALRDLNRPGEALASYARALRFAPDSPEIHWNEGLCRLLMGDFAVGWAKYEWRWKTARGAREARNYRQPYWTGKDSLENKTLLLYGEQGFGDTIQFCRYARHAAARGAKVVLEVQPQLKTLLAALDGVMEVVGRGERLPDFDCYASLMSMPLAFQADLSNISGASYLRSDPKKFSEWQSRLGESSRKKVGLVWSGSAEHKNDHNRSLTLEDIKVLVDDSADFYCLQKELRAGDRSALTNLPGIRFFGDSLRDFSDTAALVDLMDVVITVDTSVAHLAGALGKEVWLLLAFSPDWRWLLDRSDSPWYQSARLFRQAHVNDWAGVVTQVRAELKARLALGAAGQPSASTFKQAGAQLSAGRIAAAIALHQQGRLDQAELLYKEVLQLQPGHFDALQLLGTVAAQRGHAAEAVGLFEQALQVQPDHASLLNNYGAALQNLQRHEEALKSYDRALRIIPNHVEALNNRGTVLRDLQRPAEALESCDRALQLKPDYPEVLNNRGNALRDLQLPEQALLSYDRALEINPDYAEAHNNRGNALRDLKRPAQALESYGRALKIKPNYAQALSNRGNALRDLKRPDEALASYDRALAINPVYVEAFCNRGNALRDLMRPEEALESYGRALQIRPNDVEALINRGNALADLMLAEQALASYEQALQIEPDHAEALSNRGNALQSLQRCEEALESYARALRVKPDHAEAHWNEGLCRLLMGDFQTGWEKYEWRWKKEPLMSVSRNFSQPLWLGKPSLEGKTILLYSEQGLGDTIQFCRYASRVARLGARVVLEVQPPLKALVQNLEGVAQVLGAGESLPSFDYHCPLLSLPLAFRTTMSDISGASYLKSDPDKLKAWQSRLGGDGRKRVGLVWSGGTKHKNDRNRSLSLEDIKVLVDDRAAFYCLQKELRPADRDVLTRLPGIGFPGESLEDFSDTAAVVALMDLVITVDTSVAHLAGALGKEVWVLLPFSPDWRWLLNRNDSPWYSSVRLFRQPAPGDWASVLMQVRAALAERLRLQ